LAHLYEIVYDEEWNNDNEEYRCRVADDDYNGEKIEERGQTGLNSEREHDVHGVYVAGESVENSTDGRRVEEHHRRTHDVGQHAGV